MDDCFSRDSWDDLFVDMQKFHDLPPKGLLPAKKAESTKRKTSSEKAAALLNPISNHNATANCTALHNGGIGGGSRSLRLKRSNSAVMVSMPNNLPGDKIAANLDADTTSLGNFENAISKFSTGPVDKKPPGFNIITINVGGMRFQTHVETVEKYPTTLLGDPDRRIKFYNPVADEYFFDRSRGCFEAILYFYQSSGRLKRPDSIPLDVFVKEIKFFDLGQCTLDRFWYSEGYRKPADIVLPDNRVQRVVWQLMEHPDTSLLARIVAFISVFVIVVSTVTFCLETLPRFHDKKNATILVNNNGTTMTTTTILPSADNLSSLMDNNSSLLLSAGAGGGGGKISKNANSNNGGSGGGNVTIVVNVDIELKKVIDWSDPFFIIEMICIIWFTFEFVARFLSCPSKCVFLKSFLNWVDLAAIVPFFINFAFAGGSSSSAMSLSVLRVLRLVRVFRIFKLSRHSTGLQILGKTFQASVQELGLLVFFVLIGVILFSSAVYFAETGVPDTQFTSIPQSFWYAIVTMTTVGYGDMTPKGTAGKIVGSMCAVMGVLVLALPVPVIVANFKHFYRQETRLAHMTNMNGSEDEAEEEGNNSDSS